MIRFLKNPFRRRPPAASERQPVIEPYVRKPLDLCITTLLNDRRGPGWKRGDMRAAPWSRVLASPHLDLVRDRARVIYDAMDAAGALVPWVTLHEGSVKIEYTSDAELGAK